MTTNFNTDGFYCMLQSLSAQTALRPQGNIELKASGEQPPHLAIFRGFQIRFINKWGCRSVIYFVFFHRTNLFYFCILGYLTCSKSDMIQFGINIKINWTSTWAVCLVTANPGTSGGMLILPKPLHLACVYYSKTNANKKTKLFILRSVLSNCPLHRVLADVLSSWCPVMTTEENVENSTNKNQMSKEAIIKPWLRLSILWRNSGQSSVLSQCFKQR